jgi:hypothetical protein
MSPSTLLRALPAPAICALLAGCGAPAMTAGQMNASYEAALERTAGLAAELPGGVPGARRALARAEGFFADMNPAAVRAGVAATYAPQAYLNDNLTVVEGAGEIGEYFARTAAKVRALRVEFLDVTQDGSNYFVRWRMTVESERLNGGAPMVSYGMSHFRFDGDGRILMHKDFWDAGTGLYEFVPGLGGLLRRVRAAAEGES